MQHAFEEVDVVVVGAGPGGLASALTLGSYGIETLVLERRRTASTLPRATVASTGTMELLRRWGLEHEARERAVDVEWRALQCATLTAAGSGEVVEVGLPTRTQAAIVSPTSPLCIGQDELEPLLERRIASYPSVRLEREVELVALEQTPDGDNLVTLSGSNGARRRVRARYVVGADGLRSTVRRELGIAAPGDTQLGQRLAAVFRAPLWDLLGEHRYGIYFVIGTSDPSSFLPVGRPDRWMFGTELASAAPAGGPSPGEVAGRIRAAVGDPRLAIEIERVLSVTFGIGLAERFRQGNAFLIGDAAHRVTPRGGTGLNSAIRDGFDLGWKLSWVLRGWASDELLDSYEQERRPVAEYNTERSSRSDGSILGTGFGLVADLGGRIAHAWVPRDGTFVSTLDLLGEGLTLFVGPSWEDDAASTSRGPAPVAVERLDALTASALGLLPAGSLLARPDGRPLALSSGGRAGRARVGRADVPYASSARRLRRTSRTRSTSSSTL